MLVKRDVSVALKWIIPVGDVDSTLNSSSTMIRACRPDNTFLELYPATIVDSIAPVGETPGVEGYVILNYTPTQIGAFLMYLYDTSAFLGQILFNCIEPVIEIESVLNGDNIYGS